MPFTSRVRLICLIPRTVSRGLAQAGTAADGALRPSPLVPDFTGPVLFDAPAAASALAQTTRCRRFPVRVRRFR